ncbi:MAG: proton-conducting transporter membrane subunit [Thermoanaerobaculia bacterium]
MSWLPALVWLVPGAVGLTLWWLPYGSAWRLPLARCLALGQLLLALGLFQATATGEVLVYGFGSWSAAFGIALAAYRLSGLLVLLQSALLAVTVWILRPVAHGERSVERSLPLLFLLSFGLNGAFLTGDLFNLFVAFEVVLLASYLLIQVPGTERSLRAAFPNVAINLLASVFFFAGVGLLYGQHGTVNLADLALRMASGPTTTLGFVACGMLTVAFGIKAGMVPLLFWLPATYPTFSGPVAALFAGMMTKLGVFALLRTVPLLMPDTPIPGMLVVVGAASALLGVLAAFSDYELRRLLGFHIVSQVGYMVLGLGLLTVGAVAATIYYLTHHIVVKAVLFFVADELERRSGTRDLRSMLPVRAGAGGLAAIFLLAALSLAGLPPLSGFFAKVGLFRAAFEAESWATLAVLAIASFFTLASMLKVWRFAFQTDRPQRGGRLAWFGLMPVWLLAGVSILLAVSAGPVYEFAEATARQLLDVQSYARAVLSGPNAVGIVEVPGS